MPNFRPVSFDEMKQHYPNELAEFEKQLRKSRSKSKNEPIQNGIFNISWGEVIKNDVGNAVDYYSQEEFDKRMKCIKECIISFLTCTIGGWQKSSRIPIPQDLLEHIIALKTKHQNEVLQNRREYNKKTQQQKDEYMNKLFGELKKKPGFIIIHEREK